VNLIYQELEKVRQEYENQMRFELMVFVMLMMDHQYHEMDDFDCVMMVNKNEFLHDQLLLLRDFVVEEMFV
jgi:hypothetical protein